MTLLILLTIVLGIISVVSIFICMDLSEQGDMTVKQAIIWVLTMWTMFGLCLALVSVQKHKEQRNAYWQQKGR